MKKRVLGLLVLAIIFVACLAMPFHAGATSSIRILYKCNITDTTSNTLGPWFKVYNDGPDPLTLSQVKIRYWYSRDILANQISVCDWAQVGISNVTHECKPKYNPPNGANYYLEVGFTAGAGTVASGSNSGEIQFRINDGGWNNYNQSNDYSFNGTMTSFQQNTKVTAYINDELVYGTEPAPTTDKKFLVIVSKPLYDTGLITSALTTYQNDLTAAGWTPLRITVDSVSSSSPQYVCADPSALKSVIQNYYNQNYVGFVLIGSHPSIPTAYWRYDQDPNESINPTDLFYADMDSWTDYLSDGVYDSYNSANDPPTGSFYGQYFPPEMIWGRISAGCISSSLSDEANKVASYLDKVHDYRTYGSNLTLDQQKRTLIFYDGPDYKGGRGRVTDFLGLTTEIHAFFDNQITTPEKWKAELENGYQFAQIANHSRNDGYELNVLGGPNSTFDVNYLSAASPKVSYLNLFNCSACRYREQSAGDLKNLGATYLFNNDYTLNITGSTGPWGFMPDSTYWSNIREGKTIGEALRSYFGRAINGGEKGCPKGVLLGDPTITYSVPAITNKMAYITTNLEGDTDKAQIHAVPGQEFPINATDPEGNLATVNVTGLPTGASTHQHDNQFVWIPQASDIGKIYHLTATATDGTNHQYLEDFTVKVVQYPDAYVTNPSFDSVYDSGGGVNLPYTWTTATASGSPAFASDGSVKRSGDWSAKITNASAAAGSYVINVDVEPNTNYVLNGWLKTSAVTGTNGAQLRINGIAGANSYSLTGTNDWTLKGVYFNSGANSTLEIQCCLGTAGNTSTGTAWFDDISLNVSGNHPFVNPNFEDQSTVYDFWNKVAFDPGSTMTMDNVIRQNGVYSAKISAPTTIDNDCRFVQLVDLKPHTQYLFSGYIKAQGVVGGAGATLTIEYPTGGTQSSTAYTDTDWVNAWVLFDSGEHSSVFLECRLGNYGSESTGTAWFDNLTLTEY